MKLDVREEMERARQALAAQFERGENRVAAETVRKLMFFDRLSDEVVETQEKYSV